MLIELLLIARFSPLIMVTLVPLRNYVPYTLARQERIAKQMEEQMRLRPPKPLSDIDSYYAGDLPWFKVQGDLDLIDKYIARCLANSMKSKSRLYNTGCLWQRTKLRSKYYGLVMMKKGLGLVDHVKREITGPRGFFFLLQICVCCAAMYFAGAYALSTVFPILYELVAPSIDAMFAQPEKPRPRPYVGLVASPLMPSHSAGTVTDTGDQDDTRPTPINLHQSVQPTRHEMSSDDENGSGGGIEAGRDSPRSSLRSSPHTTPHDSPRLPVLAPADYRFNQPYLHDGMESIIDSMPPQEDFEQRQPLRQKKRVAFQELPRTVSGIGSGLARGRSPVGHGIGGVVGSGSTGVPTRSGTPLVRGATRDVRGRRSSSASRM